MKIAYGLESKEARQSIINMRKALIKDGIDQEQASQLLTAIVNMVENLTKLTVETSVKTIEDSLSKIDNKDITAIIRRQVYMSVFVSLYGYLLQYHDKKYVLEFISKMNTDAGSGMVVVSDSIDDEKL